METITKHLDDLLAFHTVATELSFTRAAENLATSKAMVSKQVRRLESYLGIELFYRSTRSVRLTSEGATLLGFSSRILELSDEAGRRLKDIQSGESGVIRISTPVSLGDVFFPSFLPTMRSLLPQVTFDADLTNEARDFRKDELDFAIRAQGHAGLQDEMDPDLVARYLGKLKDVVCASPALARKIRVSHPRDLSKHDCILSSLDPHWNTWNLVSKKEEARVTVTGKTATNQYGTVRLFALSGFGVARLPYYQVAVDLKSGALVQLFPDYQITTHSLYLVYTKGAYTSKRHKISRDGILAWFKRRPEIFA